MPKDGINVFAALPHAHYLGKAFKYFIYYIILQNFINFNEIKISEQKTKDL